MSIPVFDLHCDLLAYLEENINGNSPCDSNSNCSLPQLENGNVRLQTLALFTQTIAGSSVVFQKQLQAYSAMLASFPERTDSILNWNFHKKKVHFILAIENLSGLLEEGEPFGILQRRLKNLNQPILYASLTWKYENRFGGGDQTSVGLKRDGELALELLSENNIAIDFSHASDKLAEDMINYIHKKGLLLRPIASHSNFRSVLNVQRNLPDHIAKEIANLGGLVGINFVRAFVGEQFNDFLKHIHYGINLVGIEALALGADFFGGLHLDSISHLRPFYQNEMSNSSCYPHFLSCLSDVMPQDQIKKIAYENVMRFLAKQNIIMNQEDNNETFTHPPERRKRV